MIKRLAAAAFLLVLSCLGASAQSCWPDPNNTRANCGQPVMYVNPSGQAIGVSAANPLPITGTVGLNSMAPAGATPVTNSASAVATLPAAAAKTTYICGFSVDSNATAATSGTASITNIISGTMNFVQGVAALPAVATLSRTFAPCIPASAQNTAISVGGATGAGGGATTVNAWGYQQ